MTTPRPTASEVLDREYLEIRARLLQIAAAMDRIDRASGSVEADPRSARFHQALEVLQDDQPHRAEAIQLIFSREYRADWSRKFDMPSR